jgi:hypothetical protein
MPIRQTGMAPVGIMPVFFVIGTGLGNLRLLKRIMGAGGEDGYVYAGRPDV